MLWVNDNRSSRPLLPRHCAVTTCSFDLRHPGHPFATSTAGVLECSSARQAAYMELPPAINRILEDQLSSFEFAFAVSDATAPDMPICFVSDKFLELTGYSREEVIGRNCRFLQGPETEKRKVMEIRDAIREDRCCQVCLTNYRKDGSKFLNQFFLSAVRDGDQGIVTHYVGVQTDVSQLAGALAAPGQLQEQQAAVALGQAAGCRMCDVLMQPAEVVQQLQQLQQEQQQQQPGEAAMAPSAAAAGQQQQQQDSDDENDVVREELRHAVQVNDVIQQSHPHASGCLASSLLQPLLKIQQSFVLSDPRLPDCPIIHASEQFLQLTGYSREEVVGRNCRFLQRGDCDPGELQKLRDAMAASPPRPVSVVLLNYTKAGRPFCNALHVAPVRDAAGQLQFFIGVQLDVSEAGRAGQVGGDGSGKLHLSQRLAHMTTTGAVKVAVRGLSGEGGGLRRSLDHQGLPHRGYAARSRASCDGSGLRSSGSSRGSGLGGLAAAASGDGAAVGGEAAPSPLAPAS